MSEQVTRIIKDKDDWKNSVEIKDNAKGDPCVTIKVRSDISAQDAIDEAITQYKAAKVKLSLVDDKL